MNVIPISEPTDERLGPYQNLTDVALRVSVESKHGFYLAESAAVIERALEAGHDPISMLMEDKWLARMEPIIHAHPAMPVYLGQRALLHQVTGFHVHRGAIALMRRPPATPLAHILTKTSRLVVLEDMVDHTNVGAIIRSASSLGFDGFLVTPSCADPLYRRSVRVSMGAVFDLPWTRLQSWPADLERLSSAGFTTVAVTPSPTAQALDSFVAPERAALVLGTEGDGLASATVEAADVAVRIPMTGRVGSLNVAAAAAVVCWHLRPSNA